MKLKVSREWIEQKNSGSAHRKYVICRLNGTYLLLFLFMLICFLCCCCRYCFNKNRTPKLLTQK